MRYGIFSDVHGNLEAFEVAIDYYRGENIDKFVFLGDIIGYGANPREVIEKLKGLKPANICGNHDWAAIDKLSADYFNDYAKAAVIWTKSNLTDKETAYLKDLALTYEDDDFYCVHGSLIEPASFNYIFGLNEAVKNFTLLSKKILFVGHSHRPQIYYSNAEGVFYHPYFEINLKGGEQYIINVGSVGQPRDRDSRLSLCVYDSNEKLVLIKRLEYNIKKAADKITAASLPQILALRLFVGW
jgi:putative phosphoesterase